MFQKNEINRLAADAPEELCQQSEAFFRGQIQSLCKEIAENRRSSRVVLLSGPSASGKTTTAGVLTAGLSEYGLSCAVVSLDNYYRNQDEPDYPRNEDGTLDYEEPGALDVPLIRRHLAMVERGEPVTVPEFSFIEKCRVPGGTPIDPTVTDVVIFEGIHALSPEVMGEELSQAYGIYIRASSQFFDGPHLLLPKNRLRLARRIIRDIRTRGTDVEASLKIWPDVRDGEHRYVMQGKKNARFVLDSVHPCEPGLYAPMLLPALEKEDGPLAEELREIFGAFVPVDREYIAPDSLLREFIGYEE